MDRFDLDIGTAKTLRITLRDAAGAVCTDYDGTQALTALVWPGDDRAAAFAPTAAWITPGEGRVDVVILSAQSSLLDEGEYRLLLTLDDAGEPVPAYLATIGAIAAAGSAVAPPAYARYADLLDVAPSLRTNADADTQAGYAEDLGLAREWFDGLMQAHCTGGGMTRQMAALYGTGWSPVSDLLQTWLDDDRLVVTARIRRCCAKYAACQACKRLVTTDPADAYRRLAQDYEVDALMDARAIVATLKDAGGTILMRIDLSSNRTTRG
jgi:hypothetical protein